MFVNSRLYSAVNSDLPEKLMTLSNSGDGGQLHTARAEHICVEQTQEKSCMHACFMHVVGRHSILPDATLKKQVDDSTVPSSVIYATVLLLVFFFWSDLVKIWAKI